MSRLAGSTRAQMHLHWDMDEERVRLRHQLRTPSVTVVIYLTDAGGPTLVLLPPPPIRPRAPEPEVCFTERCRSMTDPPGVPSRDIVAPMLPD